MLRNTRLLCLTVFYVFCSSISTVHAMQLEEITCNQPLDKHSIYTILNKDLNTLGGWSHISVENDDEFNALHLDVNDYQVSTNKFIPDEECDGIKTQNVNFVVKLSDWTRQHANGIEAFLDTNKVTFADASHVMIDLLINTNQTYIHSANFLNKRYAKYLNEQQLDTLDKGDVNLGITLFEDGALDQSTLSLNAEYIIEVDQKKHFDQWLRFVIPINEFNAYQEKEYRKTPITITNNTDTPIKGFRVTAETSQGKQLRNFLGDKWSAEIPETFKEISINFRRIELLKISE